MTLPRRKPLRRKALKARQSAHSGVSRAQPGSADDPVVLTQTERRALLDDEWRAYSEDVRRRRPVCEAGDRWTSAVQLLARDVVTEHYVTRLVLVRDACRHAVSGVHHKTPRNRGPYVPSQGLTETDVVSICSPCHTALHGELIAAARALDLLR